MSPGWTLNGGDFTFINSLSQKPNFRVSLPRSLLGNFTFHSFSRTILSVSVLQNVCYTYTVPFGLCPGTVVESPCFSVSLKRRIWTCDVLVAVIVTLLTAERKLGRRFDSVHMTSRRPCWRSNQRNGGHVGGVKYSFGGWILFLWKFLLLFHYANMASGHRSEHTLYNGTFRFLSDTLFTPHNVYPTNLVTRIQIGLNVWNWTYSSLQIEIQSRRLTNLIISPMTSLWCTSMNTKKLPPRFSFCIGEQIQNESSLLPHLFLQIHYLISFHSVYWVF